MGNHKKFWNLLGSGLCVFLAIIIANSSLNLWAGLPEDHGLSAVITATVNAAAVYLLIAAAAYNSNRYLTRSQRGRRRP